MKYIEYKISDFLDDMSSTKPMPGGGTALGLIGCISISLILKCFNMTIGKKQYEQYEKELEEAKKLFIYYFETMSELMDLDAKNFDMMSKALKMPKNNDEEIKNRNKNLSKASIACVEAPIKLIEVSKAALKLYSTIENKISKLIKSDGDIAKEQLIELIELSKVNVKINLPYILDENLKKDIMSKL